MPEPSILQKLLRIVLGLMLVFAGISHLTFARIEFLAQVPDWVPIEKDVVVILSGVVEISLGIALLFLKKYSTRIGWLTALFFVLIFPGNIYQYVNQIDGFGLDTDNKRFIRLFFQPVLVAWALWSTGAWEEYMQQRNHR